MTSIENDCDDHSIRECSSSLFQIQLIFRCVTMTSIEIDCHHYGLQEPGLSLVEGSSLTGSVLHRGIRTDVIFVVGCVFLFDLVFVLDYKIDFIFR
jgi:hypothetical protein